MAILSDRIRHCRKAKRMTQRDLAMALNAGVSTVTQWECGTREPGLPTLVLLADFFDVSTDYLLGRTEDPLFVKHTKNHVELSTTPPADPAVVQVGTPPVESYSGRAGAKLNGTESGAELEAIVRRMIAEALEKSK